MSAYDKFTFAQEAINLGVIEYLTKPANRDKIVAALEKAMAVIDQERSSRSQNLLIREKLEAVVPIIENGFINLILFQDDPTPSLSRYRDLLNIHTNYGWIMVLEFGEDGDNGDLANPVGTTVKLQNHQPVSLVRLWQELWQSSFLTNLRNFLMRNVLPLLKIPVI